EPVNILAGATEVMAQARSLVGNLKNVTLHDIPTHDASPPNHGPTFLSTTPPSALRTSLTPAPTHQTLDPALIDWQHSDSCANYPPFDLDNLVPRRIAERQNRRRFETGIILEGGAIDGNGRGCILTTKSCLLNPNRNSHLSQADVERYLQ